MYDMQCSNTNINNILSTSLGLDGDHAQRNYTIAYRQRVIWRIPQLMDPVITSLFVSAKPPLCFVFANKVENG